MKDLVILAADNDMKHALNGILTRPKSLDIRPIETDIRIHPEHDPACARSGVEFLGIFWGQYRHALLVFDHEGSGKESVGAIELEESLNAEFTRSVWGDNAKAIVLSPELEAWIWSDSPHVDDVTGWKNRSPRLRPWLVEKGWMETGRTKPNRPKEAFVAALKEAGVPQSASLYKQIAAKVSLRRCQDISFLRFKTILRTWFPHVRIDPSN